MKLRVSMLPKIQILARADQPDEFYGLDSSALGFDEIAVNGGKRGLLVLVSPEAMAALDGIAVADLCS